MADTRTYIRVHDGMPDHPKVDGLSDKAFRLLVESWCWCSRHLTDGVMPGPAWRKRATPRARKELVSAGLAVLLDDSSVRFHDYLEHQRSAEEVAAVKAAKGRGGALGNHRKWHEERGIVKPGCPFCPQPPEGPEEPDDDPSTDPEPTGIRSDDRSQDRSDMRSDKRHPDGSQKGNADTHKRSVTDENFSEANPPDSPTGTALTSGNPSDPPSDNRSDIDRKTSPETTTETKGSPYGGSPDGSVSRHRADRYARERADDDLDQAIAGLVEQHTGRPCPPDHAAAVRRQLLDGRDVERPLPYVVKAIRENPGRYLPPPPPTPPRPEPWMAVPDLGARDNGAVNARGRAAVDEARAAARARKLQQQPDQPAEGTNT